MKKILLIFFSLCIIWSIPAESNTLTIKKNRVIKTKGDVFYKWPYKWKFSYIMEHWKPYAIQEITDNVRYGKTALRFELRSGSCGKTSKRWDDCKNGPFGSERYELLPSNIDKIFTFNGNVWHTISWYVEKFDTPFEGHNSIWQIHNDGDWAPMFNTDLRPEGLYWQRRTACNAPEIYKKKKAKGNDGCSVSWKENANVKIMNRNEVFDKWNDVIMNVNYTSKDSGYLKMWINGKLVYHYQGPIKPPNKRKEWSNNSAMQFGIYRMAEDGVHPHTQINYYDEIRYAKKKCSKLKLEQLGYSCDELESQKIKVDTLFN